MVRIPAPYISDLRLVRHGLRLYRVPNPLTGFTDSLRFQSSLTAMLSQFYAKHCLDSDSPTPVNELETKACTIICEGAMWSQLNNQF
ncbi:hypothetical protein LMH87_001194 [Akanthomyces muscarius]|uniref:Uncharacterized protein n=1 Tax=Akanthomyces muscarius TaxID=2231603 RepID=A0A9W8UNA9_AKAMU|nr:hypothetical protein LMH87_001194 [Akanthomyces muscarius]KAJ4155977.1 hypothetical protein LMH87_001194 [Akanthomyces muscarius]